MPVLSVGTSELTPVRSLTSVNTVHTAVFRRKVLTCTYDVTTLERCSNAACASIPLQTSNCYISIPRSIMPMRIPSNFLPADISSSTAVT